MSETELTEYFNEHLLYELQMLRFSKSQLESKVDPVVWNAMFAAFNVSARNLYEFLKGEQDNVSVTDYRDYCPSFKRDSASDITGTLQMLNAQCFHMGRKRSKAAAGKVSLDRIKEMSDWLEGNMSRLIASLSEALKVDLEKAQWQPIKQPAGNTGGPTGPILRPPEATLSTSTPSEVIFVNPVYPKTKKPSGSF
jgi:hypothetical protein